MPTPSTTAHRDSVVIDRGAVSEVRRKTNSRPGSRTVSPCGDHVERHRGRVADDGDIGEPCFAVGLSVEQSDRRHDRVLRQVLCCGAVVTAAPVEVPVDLGQCRSKNWPTTRGESPARTATTESSVGGSTIAPMTLQRTVVRVSVAGTSRTPRRRTRAAGCRAVRSWTGWQCCTDPIGAHSQRIIPRSHVSVAPRCGPSRALHFPGGR